MDRFARRYFAEILIADRIGKIPEQPGVDDGVEALRRLKPDTDAAVRAERQRRGRTHPDVPGPRVIEHEGVGGGCDDGARRAMDADHRVHRIVARIRPQNLGVDERDLIRGSVDVAILSRHGHTFGYEGRQPSRGEFEAARVRNEEFGRTYFQAHPVTSVSRDGNAIIWMRVLCTLALC